MYVKYEKNITTEITEKNNWELEVSNERLEMNTLIGIGNSKSEICINYLNICLLVHGS